MGVKQLGRERPQVKSVGVAQEMDVADPDSSEAGRPGCAESAVGMGLGSRWQIGHAELRTEAEEGIGDSGVQ